MGQDGPLCRVIRVLENVTMVYISKNRLLRNFWIPEKPIVRLFGRLKSRRAT